MAADRVMRRWRVVRVGLYENLTDTLGVHRWRWVAEIHHLWSNIGLRRSVLVREDTLADDYGISDVPERRQITPRQLSNLYRAVAAELKGSGEVAGEGFILRLAEITVDVVLKELNIEVDPRVVRTGADGPRWTGSCTSDEECK